MKDAPREVELKFRLVPEAGAQLLASLGGGEPTHERLEATYFDTADCDLRGAGFFLRVRREGDRWKQTIKSTEGASGALGRGEWESETPTGAPDIEHALTTPAGGALAKDASLTPKFVVRVDRRTVAVEAARGAVACSLDHGQILASGRSAGFDELELELKSGEPQALFDLARDLGGRFDLELSFTAKADRGYALMSGEPDRPRKFAPPHLGVDMSAGDAFRAIARAALEQIARNIEPLRGAAEPEATHQMRVGARRLRATLKTFRPIIEDERLDAVEADLKWLGAELDPARNLDVFIEGAWRRAMRGSSGDDAVKAAKERLEAARAGAYARALTAAASPTLRAFLLETLIWIESGPWTEADAPGAALRDGLATGFARQALSRARRRVLHMGRGLCDLSAEDRHKVRIRAKELRYAADALEPLFEGRPKRARRFMSALEDLLEDLGDLNDIVTAETLAGDYPPADDLIACEARRGKRLLGKAGAHFADLKAAKPFWTA